ncbi:MAG: aspartate carbamoyltransferase catalytic subunit [Clostridiales bacterium]|jgi:aspartate carbamoyltransferase catalytic subunit|nr:aspartate carbamoyltransferase catalytic subunit [Clostridiales bacterium]
MFKNLLNIQHLSAEEISLIMKKASEMKTDLDNETVDVNALRGKNIVTLFYENSTRTRTSFENAGKFLGANVTGISIANSSVQKGESLIDTGRTLDALSTHLIVIRHSASGAANLLADNVRAKIINAGDGMHEHPTQALLDMFTVLLHYGTFKGLKIAILGDIKHSRVVRSNIWGFSKMGAEVVVYGPSTLIPDGIDKMPCKVACSVKDAVSDADAVMGLRIQLERQQKGLFPSISEYKKYFGIDEAALAYTKPRAIVMHPGPVNRNVEMASEIIDGERSVINEQVSNGQAVRMALLKLMLKGE